MPCPRTQQANLPACSPQPPLNAERQAWKLRMPFFKVFWYDSTKGMNPRSTDCETDALTTTPSRSVKLCFVSWHSNAFEYFSRYSNSLVVFTAKNASSLFKSYSSLVKGFCSNRLLTGFAGIARKRYHQ